MELLHAGNLGAVAPPDSSLANRSTFLGVEITTAPEDAGWLFGGAVSRLGFGAAFLASLLSVPLLPGSFQLSYVKKAEVEAVRQQCQAYRDYQQNLAAWRQRTVELEGLWKRLQQSQLV